MIKGTYFNLNLDHAIRDHFLSIKISEYIVRVLTALVGVMVFEVS